MKLENNSPTVLRGRVDGKEKYCRIPIRRKRAALQATIDYFISAIAEGDEIINEFSPDEQAELRAQQSCFVTALDALRAQQERVTKEEDDDDN